ncbi:stress protein [Brenneria goodwinii]|uniref:Stress protein n=2 Tax=Brenneria TaxID=71655 RepID=A0AAE8ERD6_9GAMM|nr:MULTISPECIES: Dabb family protein [Brenneria]ATA25308.1 stress protein [Brenneria goodwinii]MCG8158700.1 Dabb family protein [Brenneria goodwinii]MCG8162921.1 Dabb family protein [Brenneria goodwinii]MCG8167403.1 Dabb family protein [Brenneria goodwinii]MCG8172062.1 Dabb family protein [Brenneria goodwinii]
MIRHILLITFTAQASAAEIEQVKTAFLQMPENIEGVQAVEWGYNDSPEGKNAGFTHCVMMTFRDEQARQRYLPHPKHDELKAIFRPVLSDIIVLDYPVLSDNSRVQG